jgi:hypothetical protein
MGNDVVVPKQEVILSFEPKSRANVTNYVKLVKAYNLGRLGIEVVPLVDRYWEFSPFVDCCKKAYKKEHDFLGSKPTPRREDWIVLPEKAKLVVKDDITIQRMFEELKATFSVKMANSVPDTNREYYLFQRLFRNVLNQKMFKKKLLKILDSPPIAENSTTTSLPVLDIRAQQEVEFEFIVTAFATWRFVRLLSVRYNNIRFEHYVKKPDGRNVYSRDEPNIELLKNSLIAFNGFSTLASIVWLIGELFRGTENILINEDMALRLSLEQFGPPWPVDLAEFKTIEVDYTMFLE